MNKEEIKELFNKYCVKDLKDKNGQSECYFCKNTKHRYSLTWTSFLYEYKEHYYCYDCLLGILLQEENKTYKDKEDKIRDYLSNTEFEERTAYDKSFCEGVYNTKEKALKILNEGE